MSYKKGDVLGKYKVTRDFDSTNGGQGQWGFAEYNGEEYFIKKFLNPVYPEAKTPGSEKGKQKKRAKCQEFERKHLAMMKALEGCGDGGLVVKTTDFFKHGKDEFGSHYFKVSQKVDTSNLSDQVHNLDQKKRLFVMVTSAGALKILHRNKIIHLDLKPDNILIQEWEGKLIAKIIDFDSSMIEGDTVPSEELVGDQLYLSPEFAKHIGSHGEEPPPTKKSDVFSLGLLFCQYWTGKLPNYPEKYNYPYEALLDGQKLKIPIKLSDEKTEKKLIDKAIFQLLEKMLISDSHKRISIEEVHETLKAIRSGRFFREPPKTPPTKIDITSSRIRTTIDTIKGEKKEEKGFPKSSDSKKVSRVRMNFRKKYK